MTVNEELAEFLHEEFVAAMRERGHQIKSVNHEILTEAV